MNDGKRLTIDDVLGIKYPSNVEFGITGDWLGFLWNDGGSTDVWWVGFDRSDPHAEAVSEPRRATTSGTVTSWAPLAGGGLAWSDDRGIGMLADPRRGGRTITVGAADHVAAAPTHDEIAAVVDRRLVTWKPGADPRTWSLEVEVGIINPGPAHAVKWSLDSRHLALATRDDGRRGLIVVGTDGTVRWRGPVDGFVTGFCWMAAHRLVVTIDRPPLERVYEIVDVASGAATVILTERGDDVLAGAGAHGFPVGPIASPDGGHLVITRVRDGWAHLDLWSLTSGTLTPLTSGAFDCTGGGRFDHPRWSPDGRSIFFVSSEGDWSQRQLWRTPIDPDATVAALPDSPLPAGGTAQQLTQLPGTNWWPVPRPPRATRSGACQASVDVAFLHAGPHHSPDIWGLNSATGTAHQLTRSMPGAWVGTTTVPRHVRIVARDGTLIHADLYVAGNLDPQRPRRALIFAHGGTIDQMRHGWHPGLPYLAPMSWHQYLVNRGWAVLTVDYRGSSGYGLDYQTALWGRMGDIDVTDCVDAGRWLAEQDWVAPSAVAIWGISYGGYLTLASLTKHPGTFAAGISVAGVWDWQVVRDERATSDALLSATGTYRMTAGATGQSADDKWAMA
ncbi:MAG: prolyl oligopeptidase family serine peptidase, partial [Nitriliruptoraceae bacterium]